MTDWRWMSEGGILLDGSGDIATTRSDFEELAAMVRTRLKAELRGWKLYAIGADIQRYLGNVIEAELESSLRRQVIASLTRDFLPAGSFEVETLPTSNTIQLYVYFQKQLIASVQVDRTGQNPIRIQ